MEEEKSVLSLLGISEALKKFEGGDTSALRGMLGGLYEKKASIRPNLWGAVVNIIFEQAWIVIMDGGQTSEILNIVYSGRILPSYEFLNKLFVQMAFPSTAEWKDVNTRERAARYLIKSFPRILNSEQKAQFADVLRGLVNEKTATMRFAIRDLIQALIAKAI